MTSTFTGLAEGREPITLFEFASRVMSKWLAKVVFACSTSALFVAHGCTIPFLLTFYQMCSLTLCQCGSYAMAIARFQGERDVRQGRWHG